MKTDTTEQAVSPNSCWKSPAECALIKKHPRLEMGSTVYLRDVREVSEAERQTYLLRAIPPACQYIIDKLLGPFVDWAVDRSISESASHPCRKRIGHRGAVPARSPTSLWPVASEIRRPLAAHKKVMCLPQPRSQSSYSRSFTVVGVACSFLVESATLSWKSERNVQDPSHKKFETYSHNSVSPDSLL